MLFGASIIIATHLFYLQQDDKVLSERYAAQDDIDSQFPVISPPSNTIVYGPDPLNNSYYIENFPVALADGIETRIINKNPEITQTIESVYTATGDVNQDGRDDTVLILKRTIQEDVRYFLVLALQNKVGYYEGSAGVYLGRNLSDMSATIQPNYIEIRYMNNEEPATKSLIVEGLNFLEGKSPTQIPSTTLIDTENEEEVSEDMSGNDEVSEETTETTETQE